MLPDWHQVETHHGDKRPLSDDQRRVIDVNRCQLVKVIDPDGGIIDGLYDNKCFSFYHKDYIEHGGGKLDKVDKLLDIMRRRSVADFNKLVGALHTAGQPLLAQLLKEGGGKLVYMKISIQIRLFVFFRSRWAVF